MRRWSGLCAATLILITWAAVRAEDPKPPEGYQALFNGKDLSGWKVQEGGKMEAWGAENGVLYTSGSGGAWLLTEKEYGDFEIMLEYKVPENGNSGVALRTTPKGDPAYVGMEIQILDDDGPAYKTLQPWQYTGSIYNVVPAARIANRPIGEWNLMRIVANGPRIRIEQNGEKLVDANLEEYVKEHAKKHPGLLRKSGHIGLQSYNTRVEFRNLYLKPLKN